MSSASTSVAAAVVAAPPSRAVHFFQPSAATLEASSSFMEDDEPSTEQRTSKSSRGGGSGGRRKLSGSAAAAAAASEGNNTSAPSVSLKVERAEKRLGGKKALHTNTSANPSLSPWRQSTRSVSPSGRGGKQHQQHHSGRHHDTAKKRPMRPIEDVLSRIRHEVGSRGGDEALDPFTIAYIDRVWGDQEVGFLAFFTSEDSKDVPLHRISYMRYFDEIIWNRAARYDAVFGSSNSNKTLPDWLEEAATLRAAQELRWARLLAQEALDDAKEARMLAALGVSIAEQREEIQAMQARMEMASNAGSAFDLGEHKEEEEDEEEQSSNDVSNNVSSDEAELDEPMRDVAAATPAAPAVVPVDAAQPMEAPLPVVQGADGVSFENLAPRAARGGRGARGAVQLTVAAAVVQPTVPPSAAPIAVTVAAAAAPAQSPPTTASTPFIDDDTHVILTASLLRPDGRVLRSSPVRVSLHHFDLPFLKKRLARKLHVEGGARQVKRVYLQRDNGDTVRINENNFQKLLTQGAQILVMQEVSREEREALLASKEAAAMEDATAVAPSEPSSSSSSSVAPTAAAPAPPVARVARPVSASAAPPSRPTHFVSLRITSPPLLEQLRSIQSALLEHDPRYAPFLVPAGTFHITVSLLSLRSGDAEQVQVALRVLEEQLPRMKELLSSAGSSAGSAPPLSLPLRGVGNFRDTVVFADVAHSEARDKLGLVAALLSQAFEEAGVGSAANNRKPKANSKKKKAQQQGKFASVATPAAALGAEDAEGEEAFTPHLTLAKMSRAPPSSAKGKRGGGGKERGGGKGPAKPFKQQQQRYGMEGEEDTKEDAQVVMDDVPMPAANPFALLPRDDSRASQATTSTDADMPAAVAASPAAPAASDPPAPHRNPSTSVIRRLDAASYQAFVQTELGTQPIVQLDLCSMQGPKQADGYYQVIGQVTVG